MVGYDLKQEVWYDFGELQVFKSPGGQCKFLNTGGDVMDLDVDTAATFFSLQGNRLEDAAALLQDTGYGHITREDVGQVRDFLLEKNIVKREYKKPKSRRYDTRQVLYNIRDFDTGPVFIQDICFTIGNACPLECDYCFRKEFDYKARLTLERLADVCKDLKRLGCLTVNISGGEPSIFSDFVCSVAQECKQHGFENISVNTSGFKLDRKKLQDWQSAGITFLNIKLDTMDEKTHDRILKWDGAWKMAVQSIKDTVDLGIQSRINCTAYYETVPQIENLIKFSKDIGVYKLRVNPYVPRPGELAPVHPETNKMVADKVRRYVDEGYNVYTPFNDYDDMPEAMICPAGITKAVIEVDGGVGSCQFVGDYPEPAGNIMEDSFLNIWTKGKWDFYRKNVETERVSEPCASCDWRKYCVSTCIAIAHALFGDGKITNPVECPFYKKAPSKNKIKEKSEELEKAAA